MSDEQMVVRPNGGAEQVARRGFGEQALERRNTAAVAMAERARAEVQASYIVAMQRPRNVDEFRSRLLSHTKRLRFAEAARYRKPIGDGHIEGASIRFVETALNEYSNVKPACTVVYEDDDQITVEVKVTDLERNISYSDEAVIRKRMERRRLRRGQVALAQRTNSRGELVYVVEASDDDVANMKASRQSKLLRNLGLRILPADVVAEAMDACIATVQAGVDKDPAAARKILLDAFGVLGISPAMVTEYIGHPLEQLQPREYHDLREMWQAIRDGEATWQEFVAAKQAARGEPEKVDAGGAAQAAEASAPDKGVAGAKAALKKSRQQQAPSSAPPPQSPLPTEPAVTPAAASAPAAEPPAPAPPVSPTNIELAAQIRGLYKALETILQTPEMLPMVRAQIERLPEIPDRRLLIKGIERAERLAKEDAAAKKDPHGA